MNKDRFVAALKYVSHGPVAPLVNLSVDAVKLVHSLGEISLRCFDRKMIVVVHQTGGVAQPVKAVNDLAEDLAVPSLK